MKTRKAEDGQEIDVKRFYLPGIVLKFNCKKCKNIIFQDYGENYLSYPITGKQEFHIYCGECDSEYELQGSLNISISYDEKSFKLRV